MPITQRRSKPVNGRVLAFSLFTADVGVVDVGSVVVVGVVFSVVGDVPVVGVVAGVVAGFVDVVGVVGEVGF
jgi:hypothetical protein